MRDRTARTSEDEWPTRPSDPPPSASADPDLSLTSPLRTTRIEALTDGVFAIAMTLLILPISVPEPAERGPVALVESVLALWPSFLGYAVTFLVLGGYWTGQHSQFHLIRRADHVLLWETMVFLMFIAALPFTAALLGAHLADSHSFGAVLIYCGHLVAIGLAHYATWRHATRRRELVDPTLPRALVRRHTALALVPPVVYALAMPLAWVSGTATIIVCAIVPLASAFVPHALALRAKRAARMAGRASHGPPATT